MINAHCDLREIIWEITNKCYNNCEYCGSKNITKLKNKINENNIKKIADRIFEFIDIDGKTEVNISGGDPLLVDLRIHKYIKEKLGKKCKLKIIINPKSDLNPMILKLYDWIGISVNTLEELKLIKNKWANLNSSTKITIITNFNLINIWNYEEIESFVLENDLTWQIQYTMFIDDNNAIYKKDSAKKSFFDKITESYRKKVKLVLADNLNNGKCTAGINSIGILYDGTVVPCLSMRSWDSDICKKDPFSFKNLLIYKLENIWINGFAKWRCKPQTCCKDICNSPYVTINLNPIVGINLVYGVNNYEPSNFEPSSYLYGVRNFEPSVIEPNIVVYGVFPNKK